MVTAKARAGAGNTWAPATVISCLSALHRGLDADLRTDVGREVIRPTVDPLRFTNLDDGIAVPAGAPGKTVVRPICGCIKPGANKGDAEHVEGAMINGLVETGALGAAPMVGTQTLRMDCRRAF